VALERRVLGDGSFQAGIRATELRTGKDVGTSLLTGATEERFEILKWFSIEADDDTGYDAAAEVIERAMGYLDESTPRAETDGGEEDDEPRDLLDDLATVLGNERVPAADVPARLRKLAPGHAGYLGLNGVRLRRLLELEYGIKVPSTGNRYPVDPVAVRARISELDAAERSEAGEPGE
jgi:S-DNA-T family DNA segregation ATPase FtsK/SpoIIIE